MNTKPAHPFNMTPAARALRAVEKFDALIELLQAVVVTNAEQVACFLSCSERNAQKTLKAHVDRGLLKKHNVPYAGTVYGFARHEFENYDARFFDPRRTGSQTKHLLACGWLWIRFSPNFARWKNDFDTHANAKARPSDSKWLSIPDAVGITDDPENGKKCTIFEVELHHKSNSKRARFYCDCMNGKAEIYAHFPLEKVVFFCSTEKHKNRLQAAIRDTVYRFDERDFYIGDTKFWRRFEFKTLADLVGNDAAQPAVDSDY